MPTFDNDIEKSPVNERELDPTRCIRFYSSGLNAGTMASQAFSGGAVSFVNSYSDTVHNYAKLTISTTVGSRCWISDRRSSVNSMLVAGMYEMDCIARVRVIDPNSETGFVVRVGFSAGHTDPGADVNSISFQRYGTKTWKIVTSVNTSLGSPEFSEVIDTGVSSDDWHTLGVWVNAEGTEAVYSIDGKIVHRVSGVEKLPNVVNTKVQGFIEGTVYGQSLQTGVVMRNGSIASVGPETHVDWVASRLFSNRGS